MNDPAAVDPANILVKTRYGPMLALANDVYITRSLALYGEYCPAEWRMLRQAITPGMTVLEIGANMGSHSVEMARACAPGPFYAFEPQQRLFQLLCANLALNGVTNAIAYPDACGEEEGEAFIPRLRYDRVANFGGVSVDYAGEGTKIRVRTVDDLGLAACGLIKLDVEGFEARVIRGARATIARFRPVLYVENNPGPQQQELISLIDGLGYRLFWHTPALYEPDNFRGETNNIFPGQASCNMLCLPREQDNAVAGAIEIDPANWTSPVVDRSAG